MIPVAATRARHLRVVRYTGRPMEDAPVPEQERRLRNAYEAGCARYGVTGSGFEAYARAVRLRVRDRIDALDGGASAQQDQNKKQDQPLDPTALAWTLGASVAKAGCWRNDQWIFSA